MFKLLLHLITMSYVAGYRVDVCYVSQKYPFVSSLQDEFCHNKHSLFKKQSKNNMGKILYWVKDVNNLDEKDIIRLRNDVSKYGAVVIKKQRLTRYQQEAFTAKLGETVILPSSFQGNNSYLGHPAISAVSNYWQNGSWKGPQHSFGQYWHKDGNYYPYPKNFIFSILYGDEISSFLEGGGTGFIDACLARDYAPQHILNVLKDTKIIVKVNFITDFRNGLKEHLERYPTVEHQFIFKHPLNKRECVFLFKVTEEQELFYTQEELRAFDEMWKFMQQELFFYFHKWSQGDILIWDNMAVFHRAMPIIDKGEKRTLYRTMVRINL
ncbi:(3R)-3-[(carboxymethyl)amino]fatty acid oxygenase/decarboxylase [Hydra vulgaris]|uniref:(3R)-3-[(carboxymethyl)amino]fatty acid oxygenase/decarboxylase n=1 Tax=Hydra vulgaris TaxID=6087 RepID=UPI001F5ED9C6|nr:alpha-ketoglutarate-dependent 2,4-dichlorophenoxyacetate dioxygenase [Hydra vulgaris]